MTARDASWTEPAAPRSPATRRLLRSLQVLAVCVALTGASAGGYWGLIQYDGNFHAVADAMVYRSAQLSGDELRAAARAHGIKSVLNLRGPHAGERWYDDEVTASAELGVAHYDYGLSSRRFVTKQQIAEILDIVRAAPKPLLVHCKSGADRTGLVAALYRYAETGASAAQADAELSIRYGHFPYLTSRSGAMDESFRAFVNSAKK